MALDKPRNIAVLNILLWKRWTYCLKGCCCFKCGLIIAVFPNFSEKVHWEEPGFFALDLVHQEASYKLSDIVSA